MTATAEVSFFANVGTLTVTPVGVTGATATTVAVIKDIEVDFSAEHVGLWGWGTTKRVAVARHTVKIPVKVGFASFNPDVTTTKWWAWYILHPLGTSTMGDVSTTNTVQLFTIVANWTGSDGSTILKGTVSEVYFKNLPIKATEGQWMKVDLQGEGSTVSYSNS